jgi:hypothetical protein
MGDCCDLSCELRVAEHDENVNRTGMMCEVIHRSTFLLNLSSRSSSVITVSSSMGAGPSCLESRLV